MKTLLLYLLALVFVPAAAETPKYYYADMKLKSREQVRKLVQQGYDVGGINHEKGLISLIVREPELRRLQKTKTSVLARDTPKPGYRIQKPS